MANTKYIATLRLDLSKLNKDTEGVKQMLTRLKNEAQNAANTGGQAGKKMAEGIAEAMNI